MRDTVASGEHVLHAETVMGTVVSFRLRPGAVGSGRARQLVSDACAELHRLDAIFSTWRPDSDLSRLRRGEVRLTDVAPALADVLASCREARDRSRGWFDPWAMPGGVDPTGLVKGWALERALQIVQEGGVAAALLNAGGDLAGFGEPSPGASASWRVGVRHPWRPGALACVVRLDAAVATSGNYERGPHLIDPRTRRPAARAASGTVCGPSLALADALATALGVGGDDALAAVDAIDGYDAYLIRPDGSEMWTAGMPFAS